VANPVVVGEGRPSMDFSQPALQAVNGWLSPTTTMHRLFHLILASIAFSDHGDGPTHLA